MELTHDDKFAMLKHTEHKDTICAIIDAIYNQVIQTKYNSIILELINKILSLGNYKQIKRIEEFNMVLGDLIAINGVQFVDNNISKINELCIDTNKVLKYHLRNKQKKYTITVVNGLIGLLGYTLKNYYTSIRIDNSFTTGIKCKIVKKDD